MKHNVHLICGLPGAGKTTYAEQLRRDIKAVRFSIDEWNDRLFFMERKPSADFEWFYERVQRCCRQMRDTAQQVIATGTPVVFDCGFTNEHERQIFFEWAADQAYSVAVHFVDADANTRWQRVQHRNQNRGDTFVLEVTRDMFDFMQSVWHAPTVAECDSKSAELVVAGT